MKYFRQSFLIMDVRIRRLTTMKLAIIMAKYDNRQYIMKSVSNFSILITDPLQNDSPTQKL